MLITNNYIIHGKTVENLRKFTNIHKTKGLNPFIEKPNFEKLRKSNPGIQIVF